MIRVPKPHMLLALVLAGGVHLELAAIEPPTDAPATSVVDLYGDALPEGAVLRLGTGRLRHRQFVQKTAFSPDGVWLASTAANDDSGVALWEVKTGALVGRLPVARAAWIGGTPFAFSPDGSTLVTGDGLGMVRLWDVATGKEEFSTAAHDVKSGGVNSVAFSPDGERFASAGGDGKVRVWNAKQGAETFTAVAQPAAPVGVGAGGGPIPGWIAPLAFSTDGKLLAAGAAKIFIWNLESGKLIREFDGGPERLVSLIFTPEGEQLLSGGTREVPREKFGKPYPAKNVWVPEIRFWNLADGKPARELVTDDPESGFGALALSKDGRTLAAGYEEKLLLWDLPSGKVKRAIAVPKWYGEYGLAIAPDGKFVTAPVGQSLGLWDTATGDPWFAKVESHTSWISSVAYSSDGKLVVTGAERTVRAWDADTGKSKYELHFGSGKAFVNVLVISPDGALFAAGGNDDGQRGIGGVMLWHTDSGEPLELPVAEDDQHHPQHSVTRLAFSPDGARLAVARHNGDLEVWNVTSGRNLARIATGFPIGIRTAGFSADGKTVFALDRHQAVVRSWALDGVKQKTEFKAIKQRVDGGDPAQRPWVNDAVFLPGVKHLVTSQNRHLVIWALASGEAIWTLRTPGTDKGRMLGLSPDGKLLAMSDANYGADPGSTTIRVWNLDIGQELMTFEPGETRASAFAFSPDGKRLVSGMDNGTALVWDVTAARQ